MRVIDTGMLIEARGFLTSGAALTFLETRLRDLDFIAITDVNRSNSLTYPNLVADLIEDLK